jgi:DNA repair photolyase
LGGDTPTLKKCFKDEEHALEIFEKELKQNLTELQKYGLLFTFTSDPCLRETIRLTTKAIECAISQCVNCKILTKRADFFGILSPFQPNIERLAIGFTLTGHDELEINASRNAERIEAMRKLHDAGFKTFASIEPVIDFESSLRMIIETRGFCNLYKIGLESGKKHDKKEVSNFIDDCYQKSARLSKIYFKDGILKQAGINREDLPENCVNRDYNLFNN